MDSAHWASKKLVFFGVSSLLNHWVELAYWGVILVPILGLYKGRNKEIIRNSLISLLYMLTSQILLLFPSHLGRSVKCLLTKIIFVNARTRFIVCAEINHQTYSQQSSSHSIFPLRAWQRFRRWRSVKYMLWHYWNCANISSFLVFFHIFPHFWGMMLTNL